MFEPVFVCRATYQDYDCARIMVVPATVGIVKLQGCHYFAAAVKDEDGEYGFRNIESGAEHIAQVACKKRYSSVPKPGEAWLVTEGRKCINWNRADQNMFLLNDDGSLYKEDHDA